MILIHLLSPTNLCGWLVRNFFFYATLLHSNELLFLMFSCRPQQCCIFPRKPHSVPRALKHPNIGNNTSTSSNTPLVGPEPNEVGAIPSVKVLVLGDAGVGKVRPFFPVLTFKTSFVHSLCHGTVLKNPSSTTGCNVEPMVRLTIMMFLKLRSFILICTNITEKTISLNSGTLEEMPSMRIPDTYSTQQCMDSSLFMIFQTLNRFPISRAG